MKRCILIAGVNGAGKSTLYQSLPSLQAMPRINTDEIVKDGKALRVSRQVPNWFQEFTEGPERE